MGRSNPIHKVELLRINAIDEHLRLNLYADRKHEFFISESAVKSLARQFIELKKKERENHEQT